MQSLQQKLASKTRECDEASDLIERLRHSPDADASELLGRLRSGHSLSQLATTVFPEGVADQGYPAALKSSTTPAEVGINVLAPTQYTQPMLSRDVHFQSHIAYGQAPMPFIGSNSGNMPTSSPESDPRFWGQSYYQSHSAEEYPDFDYSMQNASAMQPTSLPTSFNSDQSDTAAFHNEPLNPAARSFTQADDHWQPVMMSQETKPEPRVLLPQISFGGIVSQESSRSASTSHPNSLLDGGTAYRTFSECMRQPPWKRVPMAYEGFLWPCSTTQGLPGLDKDVLNKLIEEDRAARAAG